MKLLVGILSVLLIGIASAQDEACYTNTGTACGPNAAYTSLIKGCTAIYGRIGDAVNTLQSLANDHLVASYDYLLLSSRFNNYEKNRPGFSKLFRSLSDEAFENSIKLIKHITQRGGVADLQFHKKSSKNSADDATEDLTRLDLDELHALAKVLDSEKKLSNAALTLYEKHGDGEIKHFIEEEFLEKQSGTIRKLAGYNNDLFKIMNTQNKNTALGLFLFDEYLEKQ